MYCLHEFLMEHKEAVMVYSQILIVMVILISAVALFLSQRAIKLQKNAIQTSLFSDFYKRIAELEERRDEYEEKGKIGDWCVLLLGHLEYLACLVNNKHISLKLAGLYKEMIIDYYENVLIKQREALKEHYKDHPAAFSELKRLYKKLKK